jgi:Xaa-Pro aminopeptidase
MGADIDQSSTIKSLANLEIQAPSVGPSAASIAPVLEERRERIRQIMQEEKLDGVLMFSTREHADPSRWILGTPCKSDCHYSFVTGCDSGVLEMPWRIPGLEPRLVSQEELIPVAGEHKMNQAIRELAADRNLRRIGVVGDAPFTHLEGFPGEIVDLNPSLAESIRNERIPGHGPGMTYESSIVPLTDFPLTKVDQQMLQGRLEWLRAQLEVKQVGAALLFGTEKKGQYARWLTGVPTTAAKEIMVVTPTSHTIFELEGAPDVHKLMAYPVERRKFKTVEALQAALQGELAEISSIGVVKEFPYSDLMPLSRGKTLVNINHEVESLMAIKTPQELAILRHAAQELATLMEETLENISDGMTGTEVEEALDNRILLCSSTRSFPIGAAVDGELRGEKATTLAEPLPTQVIREAVCIDMGIQYGGLVTDATRMGFVGDTPLRGEYEKLRTVVEVVVQDLKPGQTAKEFFDSVVTNLEPHGFRLHKEAVEELGHGVGFDLHEIPFLMSEEHMKMQFLPGMVFTIEPEIITPYGKIRVEEMVEITPTGAEIMTRGRSR